MGGDFIVKNMWMAETNFNPHLRMGGDINNLDTYKKLIGISIHTSVWEVTTVKFTDGKSMKIISIHTSVWEVTLLFLHHHLPLHNFNPHLRMGGDLSNMLMANLEKIFQSTPPYGR